MTGPIVKLQKTVQILQKNDKSGFLADEFVILYSNIQVLQKFGKLFCRKKIIRSFANNVYVSPKSWIIKGS